MEIASNLVAIEVCTAISLMSSIAFNCVIGFGHIFSFQKIASKFLHASSMFSLMYFILRILEQTTSDLSTCAMLEVFSMSLYFTSRFFMLLFVLLRFNELYSVCRYVYPGIGLILLFAGAIPAAGVTNMMLYDTNSCKLTASSISTIFTCLSFTIATLYILWIYGRQIERSRKLKLVSDKSDMTIVTFVSFLIGSIFTIMFLGTAQNPAIAPYSTIMASIDLTLNHVLLTLPFYVEGLKSIGTFDSEFIN